MIGAVAMGSLMAMNSLMATFGGAKQICKSATVVLVLFISLLGQLPMIWPSQAKEFVDPMRTAVATASFAEGSLLVALASLVHEKYGAKSFGVLYGTMLTFGGVGLYAFNEVFFPSIFEWYSEESVAGYEYFKAYGQWNVFLFSVIASLYFICLILAVVSHISIRKRIEGHQEKVDMIQ